MNGGLVSSIDFQKTAAVLGVFFLSWLLSGGDLSTFTLALPFFVLYGEGGSCGAGDGAGGDGSDGAGGGDGGDGADSSGSGGTGEGSAGDCSCCESSCGDCCNSGDDGGGGGSSSPFLFLWDGKGYVVENDVLVGPQTYFETPDAGYLRYQDGTAGKDTYLVDGTLLQETDGELKLALKEIEPEETFLDSLTLTRITHPKNVIFASKPSREGFFAFQEEELAETRNIENISIQSDLSIATNINTSSEEVFLNEGDSFEIRATVKGGDTPYFCLRSRYRDWVAGTIEAFETKNQEPVKSPYTHPARLVRKMLTLALTPLLFLGSGLTLGSGSNASDDIATLANHVGFRTASADTPHYGDSDWKSLIVDYWHWERGVFVQLEVTHPRYHKATLEAMAVPQEAIDASGNVHLRVTATKRHAVDLATLFVPTRIDDETTLTREEIPLKSISHSRSVDTPNLNAKDAIETKQYTHLIPGDTLELAFTAPSQTTDTYTYQLSFNGFYTKLTRESEALAGDWTSTLDAEALAHLKEVYALSTYGKENRASIVS